MPSAFVQRVTFSLGLVIFLLTAHARAVTFELVYIAPGTPIGGSVATTHAFDTDGAKLREHIERAMQDWTDIVEDNHHIVVEYMYAGNDLLGTAKADADVRQSISSFGPLANHNRTTRGRIRVSDSSNWYFDPTPNDDSEFTMEPILLSDLSSGERTSDFVEGPDPSNSLEVGYRGNSAPGLGLDLLSVMIHEAGHLMGVNRQLPFAQQVGADAVYELPSSMVGGRTAGVVLESTTSSHFKSGLPAMGTALANDRRELITAADALAVATIGAFTQIDLPRKNFLPALSGSTTFADDDNWIGSRAPDSTDDVFIAHGGTANVIAPATAQSVTIRSNSTLSVINEPLNIGGTLTVGKGGVAPQAGTLNVFGFGEANANSVEVQAGLVNLGGGQLEAGIGDISNLAEIAGNGDLRLAGTFFNNGTLRATGGTLRIGGPTIANPVADLDGDPARGPVVGNVEAITGNLQVNIANTPTFRRTMTIGAGRFIDLPSDWELTSTGTLTLQGSASQDAELRGGDLEVRGDVDVDRRASLDVNVAVTSSLARIDVPDANDSLVITRALRLTGGRITGDGTLSVEGNLTNDGGSLLIDNLNLNGDAFFESGIVRATDVTARGGPVVLTGGSLELETLQGDIVHDGGTWIIDSTTVTGDIRTTENSLTEFLISDAVNFSKLRVSGTADVEGSLSVEIANGFIPSQGDTFVIVDSGGLNLDDIILVGPHAHRFQLDNSNTQIALIAVAPLLGDFNDDGRVDAADYTVWRDNVDTNTVLPGDPTPGEVDRSDFKVWSDNYGATSGGFGTAIPEPSALLMTANLIALLAGALRVTRA